LKSHLLVTGLLAAVLLLLSGCASEEVQQVRAVGAGEALSDDAFTAAVTLCRKVGSKSGRRIGAGHEFKMSGKSYVRAFVDFTNVKAERPYTVHLIWIRPDGREMFRKYAEVRQSPTGTDEFLTVIDWLDAEDLHKVKADTLVMTEPDFTLGSRFNVSQKKDREPGLYHFRVYLDRALLLEESFTVMESG
jgi:hypothetical protein